MTPDASRRPRRAWAVLPLLPAALALAACSGLVQEPDVDVVGVDLLTLGLTSGSVRLVLDVENPNRFDLTVQRHAYHLEVQREAPDDWATLARGADSTEVVLPAGETLRVPVEIDFRYRDLGAAAVTAVREGSLAYRLSGDVRVRSPVGGLDVPYRTDGVLEP